jgi:hypothetical protein
MDSFSPNKSIRVVQICPTNIGGVADFARILAERMSESGLREITIPASWSGVAFPEDFVFDREHDVILFHFSGYEYGHRGMCGWIVKLIKELRQSGQARGVVTYFHELYAFGPPWRSAFWVSAFHRYFVYQVLAASDRVFTNTQQRVRTLQRFSFRKRDIEYMPVFSTVMEPSGHPNFNQRSDTAVLFGIEDNRKRALRAFGGLKALTACVRMAVSRTARQTRGVARFAERSVRACHAPAYRVGEIHGICCLCRTWLHPFDSQSWGGFTGRVALRAECSFNDPPGA